MTLTLLATIASAATLTVGAPFATLQDAVDASAAGDHIEVPAGEWAESVIITHELTLESIDGPAVTTVTGNLTLDAPVLVRGLAIAPRRDRVAVEVRPGARVVLDNVDIMRATGWSPLIEQLGGRLTIINSYIHDSTVNDMAINASGQAFTLRDSVMERIDAEVPIDCQARRTVMVLERNTLQNNRGSDGLLFYSSMGSGGRLVVRDNDILGNIGDFSGVLTATMEGADRVNVTGNRIVDNVGGWSGIITAQGPSYGVGPDQWTLRVHGNTFVSNSGGDLMIHDQVKAQVANNIFAYSEGTSVTASTTPAFLDYNLWWSNHRDIAGGTMGPGALTLAPMFIDFSDDEDPSNDDLGVTPTSPVFSAGIGPRGTVRDIGAL